MKRTLAAGCILVLSALALPASAKTIRIGEITTLSGADSVPGGEIDHGARLYLKTHEKDLPKDVSVEILVRDATGPNPEVAKRLAQELVTREHVDLLMGCIYTPNALAIAPIATEAKVPFVVLNAATALIPRKSPYIVRDSFTLWQTAMPLGKWAAEQGGRTGYTAVSDYAPGWDAEHAFAKGFADGGGKMLGAIRFPLGNLNYVPYLQRVADAKPQYFYIFVPVAEAVPMMRAVASLDLKGKGITVVSTMDLVPDEQLAGMGDIALGLVTSGTYSAAAKRPENQAFVAAWKKEYGAGSLPDFTAVQGYDGMAMIVAMLKATGGNFDVGKAMAFFSHYKDAASPRGPWEIDPATRDIIENIYIRRVETVDGQLANVEFQTIPQIKDPWKEMNPEK
ncbi:MAG TPA: ABC transporter substrate-binding protein [Stellaceae bacterium]|nr:ABC transporter substrate-binding protein [Stellaceae bacterium]